MRSIARSTLSLTDLREDEDIKRKLRQLGRVPLTYDDLERAAYEIGAARYFECTVVDRKSIVRILETIVSLA